MDTIPLGRCAERSRWQAEPLRAGARAADGKPDFSGVWLVDGFGPPGGEGTGPTPRTVFFDVAHGLGGQRPPYLPWAAKLRDDRREQEAKDNPDARCLPLGPLQMLAHPLPKKIVQMPGLLVLLHERNMEFRQIFLDGRPLPADQQPSWYGYSTGRWEGDTLVVETSGFRDGLWADFYGSPLTDQAKMTERYRRPNFGTLLVQVTIDDPKAYSSRGPSTSTSTSAWTPSCSSTRVSRTRKTCRGSWASRRGSVPRSLAGLETETGA